MELLFSSPASSNKTFSFFPNLLFTTEVIVFFFKNLNFVTISSPIYSIIVLLLSTILSTLLLPQSHRKAVSEWPICSSFTFCFWKCMCVCLYDCMCIDDKRYSCIVLSIQFSIKVSSKQRVTVTNAFVLDSDIRTAFRDIHSDTFSHSTSPSHTHTLIP